ncbi:MAG: hypothetical protein NTU73_07710, partial [Ignavibacteriae bacterium]|nr:hypothetical protein [Ignavibacteriota bacterium]
MKRFADLSYTFDKYLDQSPGDAYNLFRDEKNIIALRRYTNVIAVIFGIVFFVSALENGPFHIVTICYFFVFISSLVFRIIYKKTINISNIRRYIFIALVTIIISKSSIDIIKKVT